MAAGVDVGVDAHRDARCAPGARGDGGDPRHLAGRLGVDGADAEADRALELVARLADAGEDDLVRREAGAQRDLDLAARVGVGAWRPSSADGARRRGGVRLDRVVEPMADVRKRRVERAVALGQGARCRRGRACPNAAAIAVEPDAVADELALPHLESGHEDP